MNALAKKFPSSTQNLVHDCTAPRNPAFNGRTHFLLLRLVTHSVLLRLLLEDTGAAPASVVVGTDVSPGVTQSGSPNGGIVLL